jgi:putative DNA methylase
LILCEKKKLAQEALGYNALVLGWPEIARLSRERQVPSAVQQELL